ncbi:conserved hypothetical protein [Rhodococcus ruber]|uniref:SRPBCC family protein n=2 Tax=Nocardiaceae TaxID=85025 RepID=A0A098BNC4_9NOCA|nr:conserved hypothetical protein [Rhodococcus ruber]
MWNSFLMAIRTLAAVTTAVSAFVLYRRWHRRWGATTAECAGPMPGDDILSSAAFSATRALTIDAPAECVWPWIVQVGYNRAGFYSYDRLDNLGRPSATTIDPRLQCVEVGDVAAPMASPATAATSFRVHSFDPGRYLVWAKPDSTWSWRLDPVDGGRRTRLVSRLQAAYRPTPSLPLTVALMELADFPMMRRMLLGIRERAERLAARESARSWQVREDT